MTYLTGMELICEERPNINIGYKMPGAQIKITVDIKSLRGFEVAVGSGGIHAIRIITDSENSSSQWLGDGRSDSDGGGACITTQLVSNEEICALRGAYDVSSFHLSHPCHT